MSSNRQAESNMNKIRSTQKDSTTDHDVSGHGKKTNRMIESSKAYVSSAQLAKLKSGPRVHVFVGPANDQFVGIEGAYANLLAHYSNYAKAKLLKERVPGLAIIDGAKVSVVWIYKYMLAGENDPEGLEKFDQLSITDLVLVYSHCAVLEYQSLMDRILARLHEKLFHSLPDVPTVKNIAIFAPSINKLVAKSVARILVQPLTFDYEPYVQHAAEDEDFSSSVGATVKDMLERRIATGFEYYNKTDANRYVKWSNEYYHRKAQRSAAARGKKQVKLVNIEGPPPEVPGPVTEAKKQKKAHNPKTTKKPSTQPVENPKDDVTFNDTKATVDDPVAAAPPVTTDEPLVEQETAAHPNRKRVNKPQCYACKARGHTKRECPNKGKTDSIRDSAISSGTPITVSQTPSKPMIETPNLSNPIKVVKKQAARPPPICFACNEEGHIARNCPAPPAAYLGAKAASMSNANGLFGDTTNQTRSSYARNKNQRRAKAERACYAPIVDSGNVDW